MSRLTFVLIVLALVFLAPAAVLAEEPITATLCLESQSAATLESPWCFVFALDAPAWVGAPSLDLKEGTTGTTTTTGTGEDPREIELEPDSLGGGDVTAAGPDLCLRFASLGADSTPTYFCVGRSAAQGEDDVLGEAHAVWIERAGETARLVVVPTGE